MKSLIEYAKAGIVREEFTILSKQENISLNTIVQRVADGEIVIIKRGERLCGIGKGVKTKVNVNIGTSSIQAVPDNEIEKAMIAERYGADTLSELSMGGEVRTIREKIAKVTTLPLTTVPVYETASQLGIQNLDSDSIIKTIREHAKEGISSVVIHTISQRQLEMIKNHGRIMGVVSKGGSIIASYMHLHSCENPHISKFDEILEILHEYDMVLSLGNTMRSGCIHDPRDIVQEVELAENIKLARRALSAGVQTIIEWSGGHVSADRIKENISYYKERSGFPLFVAGPLPIDTAVGHDHIAGAIGASLASGYGADYLCYLTPSEHLGLPTSAGVQEGLIAFRIAAHIGDSMKFGLSDADYNLARCRHALDWDGQFQYAIDGQGARSLRNDQTPCTMCGDFCAIRLMNEIMNTRTNS